MPGPFRTDQWQEGNRRVPQAIEQALQLHQQGRLSDADRLYQEVLRTRPRDFGALHMLGVLRFQQGQPQEALRLISAALAVPGKITRKSAISPANPATTGLLGILLLRTTTFRQRVAREGRSHIAAARRFQTGRQETPRLRDCKPASLDPCQPTELQCGI